MKTSRFTDNHILAILKLRKVCMENKTNIQNSDLEWPSDELEYVPSCQVCSEIN